MSNRQLKTLKEVTESLPQVNKYKMSNTEHTAKDWMVESGGTIVSKAAPVNILATARTPEIAQEIVKQLTTMLPCWKR